MEEILHHLGWLKPYKQWDKPPINWCKISSIHCITDPQMPASALLQPSAAPRPALGHRKVPVHGGGDAEHRGLDPSGEKSPKKWWGFNRPSGKVPYK